MKPSNARQFFLILFLPSLASALHNPGDLCPSSPTSQLQKLWGEGGEEVTRTSPPGCSQSRGKLAAISPR